MEDEKEKEKEKVREGIQTSFMDYTVEKAGKLLEGRWSPDFEPMGFVMYLQLVEFDVRKGMDGFSGVKFPASPIKIFSHEIVAFARTMKGEAFAQEVEKLLKRLPIL